jgi:hypothetical protein
MSDYTPGPWSEPDCTDPLEDEWTIWTGEPASTSPIVTVYGREDAWLIAAAPEMAELLADLGEYTSCAAPAPETHCGKCWFCRAADILARISGAEVGT